MTAWVIIVAIGCYARLTHTADTFFLTVTDVGIGAIGSIRHRAVQTARGGSTIIIGAFVGVAAIERLAAGADSVLTGFGSITQV